MEFRPEGARRCSEASAVVQEFHYGAQAEGCEVTKVTIIPEVTIGKIVTGWKSPFVRLPVYALLPPSLRYGHLGYLGYLKQLLDVWTFADKPAGLELTNTPK